MPRHIKWHFYANFFYLIRSILNHSGMRLNLSVRSQFNRIFMRIGYHLLVIIALLSSSNIWSATFDIYSYHSDPPFRLNNQTTDLSRAWVQQFNKLHDDVKLNLVFISRPELNKRLEAKQPYLILWANPIWFASTNLRMSSTPS